jgi:UDP-N-acetylmuramoyl-L-alanyl-D-glutamate--2,6-diaminopimelate ligase
VDRATIAAALAQADPVAGRLQPVPSAGGCRVFVDYAHTDDALDNVLEALGQLRQGGRLIVVFGCGGDRDRAKRPRMARVAQKHADAIVITSDNPRGEVPEQIIDEILTGLDGAGRRKTSVQADRRLAIELAVSMAETGDVVLIAGKGHEDYQILGDRRVPFDDVEVAREILAARGAGP